MLLSALSLRNVFLRAVTVVCGLTWATSASASIVGLTDGRALSALANVGSTLPDEASDMPAVPFSPFDSSVTASQAEELVSVSVTTSQDSTFDSDSIAGTGRAEKLAMSDGNPLLAGMGSGDSLLNMTFNLTEEATYEFSARVAASKDPATGGQHRSEANVYLSMTDGPVLFSISVAADDHGADVSEMIAPTQVVLSAGDYRIVGLARASQNGSTKPGVRTAQAEFELLLSAVLPVIAGDLDCDGDIDFDDIDAFVLGLSDPAEYEDTYGVPPALKGDLDGDSDLDYDDIPPFVTLLGGTASASHLHVVPETDTLTLAGLACLAAALVPLRRWRPRWYATAGYTR